MLNTNRWPLGLAAAMLGTALSLAACSRPEPASPTAATSPSTSSAGTVPPPTGDSTPKAADSEQRAAVQSNEKTGAKSEQSTVGTAAAGAPPYTLNSAPEGNKDSLAGTKASDVPKK